MQLGAVFPQTEIGNDPAAIRDFAQAAEAMGFSRLEIFDHVASVDIAHRSNWPGPYTEAHPFHEIFVLLGYLSACTRNLELVTTVLVLPQREAALVAKQAAEVDVLSGGRLVLGVGLGWNYVEYEILNRNFHDRGRRIEEQVAVMRALWTQQSVDFQGRWHHVTAAGLNPLPIQRPIPVWFGGQADPVLRRIARIGDGWFPSSSNDAALPEVFERLRSHTREAGRDPASIGISGRISAGVHDPETWVRRARMWRDLGCSSAGANTMNGGLKTVDEHIKRLQTFHAAVANAL